MKSDFLVLFFDSTSVQCAQMEEKQIQNRSPIDTSGAAGSVPLWYTTDLNLAVF